MSKLKLLSNKPKLSKHEAQRRARLGDLLRLYHSRYGTNGFPDDSAGREDLLELLYCTSMAPSASEKKGLCIIELWAPWMTREEAERLVHHVSNNLTFAERTPTARTLGNRLRLTNAERERLRLWTIRPCDMTDEQLLEQSKARRRMRRERKRRDQGIRSRAVHLAELKARPKPWEAENVSRATWYRRRKVRRGCGLTIVSKEGQYLVSLSDAESQQGLQEVSVAESQRIAEAKLGEAEREIPSKAALGHDQVSPDSSDPVPSEWDARTAAMEKWGTNRRSKD